MKKIFAILFLITFLTVLAAPLATSAQVTDCCKIRRTFTFEGQPYTSGICYGASPDPCPGCGIVLTSTTTSWGMACILNTIYRVADLVFAILVAAGILMIIVAAGTFLTAGGAPEKVNKARDYILYAMIGLMVAFLARAIPSLIMLLI